MDVFPKFIIETDPEKGDCLIIAKVTYHRQLCINKELVKGGGWWIKKDNVFRLHGTSEDFGRAKEEDIMDCIKRKMVFSTPYFTDNLVEEGYSFEYANECGEITKL